MIRSERDVSIIASRATHEALVRSGIDTNRSRLSEYSDLAGRAIAHGIYLKLLSSETEPEAVIDWFDGVTQRISENLGLDWNALQNRVGTTENYIEDSRVNLEKVFPGIRLSSSWETRLVAFDYVAKLVPMIIRMANGRQNCSVEGNAFEVSYMAGIGERRPAMYSSHAQHFGFKEGGMDCRMIAEYPIFFSSNNARQSLSFIESHLQSIIHLAEEHAVSLPQMKRGLEAMDGIFLVEGGWLYASNSTLVKNGGSIVFYGMERAMDNEEEADRGLAHELDHLDYLNERAGKQEVSALVLETRAISTEIEYALRFNNGMVPVWKASDRDTYKRVLEANREFIGTGTGDLFVPCELEYPSGFFGTGDEVTWGAILNGLN